MPGSGLILLAISIIVILIIAICYSSTKFTKVEYRVCSRKIKKNCKVVLLADLHNKKYGKENKALIEAIEAEQPDIILIAGDMLTANEERTSYAVPLELLRYLSGKYPVYYGNGNHEYRMKVYREAYGSLYEDYAGQLDSLGIDILANERIYLSESNIEICGLEIEKQYYKRFYKRHMTENYVESLLGTSKQDRFEILIAHNPDYFENYAKWGADLTVSGHIHGGVMRLPVLGGVISPMMRLFPKYDGGIYEEYGKKMILSRGLGMHTIPIRIFNPGELVVIHLEKE